MYHSLIKYSLPYSTAYFCDMGVTVFVLKFFFLTEVFCREWRGGNVPLSMERMGQGREALHTGELKKGFLLLLWHCLVVWGFFLFGAGGRNGYQCTHPCNVGSLYFLVLLRVGAQGLCPNCPHFVMLHGGDCIQGTIYKYHSFRNCHLRWDIGID